MYNTCDALAIFNLSSKFRLMLMLSLKWISIIVLKKTLFRRQPCQGRLQRSMWSVQRRFKERKKFAGAYETIARSNSGHNEQWNRHPIQQILTSLLLEIFTWKVNKIWLLERFVLFFTCFCFGFDFLLTKNGWKRIRTFFQVSKEYSRR